MTAVSCRRIPLLARWPLVAPISVLCAGCPERDVIFHAGLEDGAITNTGAVSDAGEAPDTVDRIGNFPEPALTQCGALPDGVDSIAGLASAWAITGPAPGEDFDGQMLPSDRVRLRFADHALGCDEKYAALTEETCSSTWSFAFNLPPAPLVPGVYALDAIDGLLHEMESTVFEVDSCGGAGGEVGGGGGPGGIAGEIEIFAVTDDCIVGELRDLDVGTDELAFDRNGGFVAMRCASDCVPYLTNHCGE